MQIVEVRKQIANPKILGLIPMSQIGTIFWCASPQIANPQIFMINPQIANSYKIERKKERIFIYLSQCTQQCDCMTHLRFHEI
jgi:hypothetical protein